VPVALRRQFSLPEEDVEHLDATGLPWETVIVGGVQWLFVHEFPLSAGFIVSKAIIVVRIVPGYPSAALDMVYVHPSIERIDRQPINAVSMTEIEGRSFQQWSRHYTPERPWRANVDNIASHLHAAEEWFRKASR
jgi:hypothetical protein